MMKSKITIALVFVVSGTLFGAWEQIGPYGGSLSALATAQSNETIVYCASNTSPAKIYRTTDSGVNWVKMSTISDVYTISTMKVDPTSPGILYATGYSTVYRSADSGANWTPNVIANVYNISDLAIDPVIPTSMYIAAQYYDGANYVMAVLKSTNSGQTWSARSLSSSSGAAYCVTIDPANPNVVYAGGYYYSTPYNLPGLYKSTDGGSSFNPAVSGIDTLAYSVNSIAVNRGNSSIIYAGTYSGGIYRSTNAGGSWTCVQPTLQFVMSIVTTPAAANIVYAGGDTTILKSTDSGVAWFSPGSGYGGAYKLGRELWVSQYSSSLVNTADSKGFFRSTNGGTSWAGSNHGIVISPILTFGVSPSSPSTIYTEYEGVGVYKTTDNGSVWNLLPTPLDCGSICEFAVHNTDANVVLGLEGSG